MRRALAVASAAFFVTGAASAQPAPALLTSDDLARAAQKVSAFKPKDAFDAPPTVADLAGRPFRVTIPLHDGTVAHYGQQTSGYWAYDAGAQVMRVSGGMGDMFDRMLGLGYEDGKPKTVAGFVFKASTVAGKPYTAQNDYGAHALVTPYRSTAVAVAESSPERFAKLLPNRGDYDASLKVSPAQARALAAHLAMAVEGVLTPDVEGRLIRCGDDYISATVSNPATVTIRTCVFNARISRVSLVRTDTGEALGTWAARD